MKHKRCIHIFRKMILIIFCFLKKCDIYQLPNKNLQDSTLRLADIK